MSREKLQQRKTICQACDFLLNVRNWPNSRKAVMCHLGPYSPIKVGMKGVFLGKNTEGSFSPLSHQFENVMVMQPTDLTTMRGAYSFKGYACWWPEVLMHTHAHMHQHQLLIYALNTSHVEKLCIYVLYPSDSLAFIPPPLPLSLSLSVHVSLSLSLPLPLSLSTVWCGYDLSGL